MTHCDAEKAVDDNSYRSASDDQLQEMHRLCLDASGPNQQAVERIRRKGEIIFAELSSREERRRKQEDLPDLSAPGEEFVNVRGFDTPEPGVDWNQAKLSSMIGDGVEESLTLEYKSGAALRRDSRSISEITKDVSAMANSAGGTLIYGVAE